MIVSLEAKEIVRALTTQLVCKIAVSGQIFTGETAVKPL